MRSTDPRPPRDARLHARLHLDGGACDPGRSALCGAIATPDPYLAADALAAAAGLGALGVAPAWSVCLSMGGRHAGVVSGAMNSFGNLGGVMSPLVVGWSLQGLGSWDLTLVSVAVLYLAAAACRLGIDPLERLDDVHGAEERSQTL